MLHLMYLKVLFNFMKKIRILIMLAFIESFIKNQNQLKYLIFKLTSQYLNELNNIFRRERLKKILTMKKVVT